MGWEWGGEVGLDPSDKTLRELYWALMAKRRAAWDHTSQILAFIAAHSGAKGVTAEKLHPYREAAKVDKQGKVAGFFGAIRAGIASKKRKRKPKPKPEGE